jgi:Xaa-Pro aminopeptidase
MYAEQLRELGFQITAQQGTLFPERAIKSESEIKQLARAERLTKRSMMQAENFLAACSIGDDKILRHPDDAKTKVKSKHVRAAIETFLIGQGAMPAHTIVACGKEGADPHNIGSGFIRANQSIIIDIFPRLLDSGYWGDMTRTYVKGKAPATLKKMYQTVREGQDIGLNKVADGVHGAEIHSAILEHFDKQGFKTGLKGGKQTGFFHGTGHGVGLEIHESPRISVRDNVLQSNQVVTVEPGLYYPNIGGIRLEDMVVVREHGCENLTKHPRKLEIA